MPDLPLISTKGTFPKTFHLVTQPPLSECAIMRKQTDINIAQ